MARWRLSLTAALALMFLLTGCAFDLELTPRGEVWSRSGEKVVLRCRAKDCPSPSIKWKLTTDRLLAGTVGGQGSESTLTIDPVTVQNQQMYRCTATCGGESKKKQKDVSLNLYSLPDAVTLETVGSLQVGRRGAVRCTVPDVYPVRLTVQWLNETGVMKTQVVNSHTSEKKNVTVTYELTPELQHSGQKLTCRVNLLTAKELQVEGTLTLDIHYPPRMINISAKPSLTVREGQNASLTCTADGNPVSIVWSKLSANGWSVIAKNLSTYQLSQTRIENSGTYRCEAKNELGKNTTVVEFRVEGGPRDTRLSVTPSSVKEGDNVTINCTTHSNPPARLVLRRKLTSGQTELKSENGTVSIRAVQLEDGGWYQCEASNDLGIQTIETQLIMQYPPKMINISAKPTLTVREGQNASLTCSADSSSPVTIVWSKLSAKGWSVIAEDQAALQLSQTRIENSGTYRCEAKNELGKSTTEVKFHVEGGPRDTRLSVTPSSVKEGDNVTINCTTHSNPPARLVLRRKLTSGQTELKSENGTVSIRAVQLEDGGWYQCEASNDLGMQTIETQLIVQYPPKMINISAKPTLTVREGQNASLTCSADSSSPVTIVWSKLSAKGWSVIAEDQAALQLSQTRIENSGTYRCEAKNELGKSTTEVKFHVEGGPRDTRLSVTPSSVKEGDNVTINCTTHSNPPARLVLRRKLTSGQTELKSENGTVSIRAVQLEDGGWYQCEASNDLGMQTIETQLIVQYPPKMINISAKPSLTVREGQNASLTCSADSSSPVTIVWSKLSAKGWSVIAEDQAALQLSQTRIENSGTYRCEAKNELGKSTTEVKFHVEGSPRDSRLSVTPSAGTEVDYVTIYSSTQSNPDSSNDLGTQTIDTEHNIQAQDVVAKAESPVGVVASVYTGAGMGSVGLVLSGLYYIYRRTNLKNSYQMSNDIL